MKWFLAGLIPATFIGSFVWLADNNPWPLVVTFWVWFGFLAGGSFLLAVRQEPRQR